MNNPSKDHGQKALSYSPFYPNLSQEVGEWDFKTKVLYRLGRGARKVRRASRSLQRKIAARSIVDPHSFDDYGRPRILTGWLAFIHILAWPTIIGVTIGFALAISLAASHAPSLLKTQPLPSRAQVAAWESAP